MVSRLDDDSCEEMKLSARSERKYDVFFGQAITPRKSDKASDLEGA
jgi:hypothetical protein